MPPSSPDHSDLRRAFSNFATGVTVVTGKTPGGLLLGVTVNSFTSISLTPPLLTFSLGLRTRNLYSFRRSPRFLVNVLEESQAALARSFARSGQDKWQETPYSLNEAGLPLLPGTLGYFQCLREKTLLLGDHLLFVGRIEACRFQLEGRPLLFYHSQYHRLGQN